MAWQEMRKSSRAALPNPLKNPASLLAGGGNETEFTGRALQR